MLFHLESMYVYNVYGCIIVELNIVAKAHFHEFSIVFKFLYQGPLLMSNQVEKKKKRLKEWEKN
jgi:hypothetical protein